ncbi:hypothetical protein [Nocardia wallacei]|uniref:hypothetical protein n=1 Tax=Nocardia wallacei TaxID=480035 RepID=UPI0024555F9C|nr:hypothetical protein [Nocardia wallacei]
MLRYLNAALVITGGRGFDVDLFDADSAPDVPAALHTDGSWIWHASVPHYLAKYGVPPELDFAAHIRANEFTLPQLDNDNKNAAYTVFTGEIPNSLQVQPDMCGPTDNDWWFASYVPATRLQRNPGECKPPAQ